MLSHPNFDIFHQVSTSATLQLFPCMEPLTMKMSTKSRQNLYTEADGGTKTELKKKLAFGPAAAACSLSPFEDE